MGKVELALCEVLRQDGVPSLDLQLAIAVCKVMAVEKSISMLHRLKQDVGSYCLMDESGFQHIDFLQACKFAEGDSRILSQKMSRDRVHAYTAGKKAQGPPSTYDEERVLEQLARKLKAAGGDQKAYFTLWNDNWEDVYKLSELIMERVISAWLYGSGTSKL